MSGLGGSSSSGRFARRRLLFSAVLLSVGLLSGCASSRDFQARQIELAKRMAEHEGLSGARLGLFLETDARGIR